MKIFYITFVFLISFAVYAQRPVQVIPSVLPPYSTMLSEYYSGTQERLKVMLINTDVAQPFLQCYLKVSVEGQGVNLQSTPYGNYPTIDLINGAPVTVSQSDLAPYFSSQHLIGSGAGNQNRLPEGLYNFCFEVYEKNTNRLIGDKQCAQAYLTLSDPAFLTLPEKGKVISYTNPFNLLFQWTPRHLSNPNAFNTEYQFDLVEIWDEGIAPEAAFYTAKPVYTTKLNTTNLFYGPGEPQLLSGKKYAWRIKTSMPTVSNGQEPFKNEGYSEIFWFKLQGECPSLQRATVVSDPRTNRTTLSWSMDATSIGSTKLDYRKKGTSRWTTVESENHQTTINGLAWNTDYEYQLGNRCVITDDFGYGAVQTFKTLTQDTANCLPKAPTPLSNQEPLAMLRMGDTIYASGFQMRIREVSGANGIFSGNGYLALMVPTTTTEVSVQASFTNLGVNTDKQVISGKIVSLYDPSGGNILNADKLFNGGIGVGEVQTGNTSAIPVSTVIDPNSTAGIGTVITETGDTTYTITIKGTDGKPVTINAKKVPATVQDTKGKIYGIDEKGKITPLGQASGNVLAGKTPQELNQLATAKGKVTFETHPDQTYAMDAYQAAYNTSMMFQAEYEKLNDGYRVGNKLLVESSSDKVIAKVENLARGLNADSIRFITGKGIELVANKITSNTFEVTVLSGPAADAQELYAIYRDTKGGKDTTNNPSLVYSLGKLKISTYKEKELSVVLVPVGSAHVDKDQIEQRLNKIYNAVGVSWTVSVAEEPMTFEGWDNDNDERLDITGAGRYNKYSDEMKNLNLSYLAREEAKIENSSPYLFVLEQSPKTGQEESGKAAMGDMLRNKQFGYIFLEGNNDIGQTAAHELAHGVFHLNHTFDRQYKFNEGDLPDNLMDYSGGDELVKMQWDAVHAPGLVIGAFEQEGDGAAFSMQEKKFFELLYTLRLCYINNKALIKGNFPKLNHCFSNIQLPSAGDEGLLTYEYIGIESPVLSRNINVKNIKKEIRQFERRIRRGIIIDDLIFIYCRTDDEVQNLYEYITSVPDRNMLLFVNGYMKEQMITNPEEVFTYDIANYWGDIDDMFMKRIGTYNVIYADGDESIATSNHRSHAYFLSSMSSCAFNWSCIHNTGTAIIDGREYVGSNKEGFDFRYNNGKIAAMDMIKKIKDGSISCSKTIDSKGNLLILDVLDVVTHSMGFAYGMGMLDVLKDYFVIGNVYNIAPENPGCGSAIDYCQEFWHYGSNEADPKVPKSEKDGVAPQGPIKEMNKAKIGGRIHPQNGWQKNLGFLESHSITNYDWIFNRIPVNNNNANGYVKKRD